MLRIIQYYDPCDSHVQYCDPITKLLNYLNYAKPSEDILAKRISLLNLVSTIPKGNEKKPREPFLQLSLAYSRIQSNPYQALELL